MAKTVITAAEVQQVAPGGTLPVPAGAIVTPLARDTAVELGVKLADAGQPTPVTAGGATALASQSAARPDELADRVRSIVTSLLGATGGAAPQPAAAPRPAVTHASIRDAQLQPFPYPGPPPGMQVETVDVVTAADGSPVAAGYMSITKGSFPWTLSYDEVQIVLEGELHLGGEAGGKIGRPGDVLFVPKGSAITFGTPSWAKFVYVTFPANWEDQIG